MIRLEHIGIAVKDAQASAELFSALFGQPPYKEEEVESEAVKTVFFQIGESKIELLEPTAPHSAIQKHLDQRGEGLHHLAFEVADIRAEMRRLQAEGFTLLNAEPKDGADNKLICFLHPKGTNKVLIELCQSKA